MLLLALITDRGVLSQSIVSGLVPHGAFFHGTIVPNHFKHVHVLIFKDADAAPMIDYLFLKDKLPNLTSLYLRGKAAEALFGHRFGDLAAATQELDPDQQACRTAFCALASTLNCLELSDMPARQAASLVNVCHNLERLVVKGSRSFTITNAALPTAIAAKSTIRILTLRLRRHLKPVPSDVGIVLPQLWVDSLPTLPLEALSLRLRQLGETEVAFISLFAPRLKRLVLELPSIEHTLDAVKAAHPTLSDFPLLHELNLHGNAALVAATLDYLGVAPALSQLTVPTVKGGSGVLVAALLAKAGGLAPTLTSLRYKSDDGLEPEDVASLAAAFPKAVVRTVALRARQRFGSAETNVVSGRAQAAKHLVGIASEALSFARQHLSRLQQLDDVEGAEELVQLLAEVRGRMYIEDN